MKLKPNFFTLALVVIVEAISYNSAAAQDIKLADFDKRGVDVINKFMKALNDHAQDENAAAVAALPLIHRSEYDAAGTNLKKDRLDYSFKKAWQNAKLYEAPVKITRVQKQSITAIGLGATAQQGTVYKVWIAKKQGQAGLPAPLNIFFPADGSAPTLNYYGSL